MGKRGRETKQRVRRDVDLVVLFQRATRLWVELDSTPRIRWRKRRRLDRELVVACASADARANKVAGRAPAVGLRAILDARGAELNRDNAERWADLTDEPVA